MEQFFDIIFNAAAIIFVFAALGFCIFSHELGHFLAAKMMGLHIDAFSLGFRPFWRKKYKGVEYRLGWLPVGGYVELPQIDGSDEIPKSADGRELRRATAWERVVTAVAGPLFNIISGMLIGCVIWIFGMPQDTPKMREITVLSVPEKSPEYQGGLRKGDVITKLNGKPFFLTWSKFVEHIFYTIDQVELEVIRDGKKINIRYLPQVNPDAPGSIGREKIAYPFFRPLIPLQVFPEPGSPAEKAGLREGDILIGAGGQPVTGYQQLQGVLNFNCGKEVELEVKRGDEVLRFTVVPQEIPEFADQAVYLIGVTMMMSEDGKVQVMALAPGSAAREAGLQQKDILFKVNGEKISDMKDFKLRVDKFKDSPFKLSVLRGGKELEFTLAARRFAAADIGISIALYDHPTPLQQFLNTVNMSWQALRGISVGIGNKIGLTESRSTLKPSHMSGPLGIGMVLFTSVRTSPMTGIYFMVVISFALAIFNLMPLPVLDGGHILFGMIEIIFRRPVPRQVIKVLSYIFVTLLIMLMVYVTFSDGRRAFRQFAGKNSAVQVDDAP